MRLATCDGGAVVGIPRIGPEPKWALITSRWEPSGNKADGEPVQAAVGPQKFFC